MFNPFKKKEENGFQMNDMELPSVGTNNFSPDSNFNKTPNNFEMPELPSLDSQNSTNPMDTPNMQSSNQSFENTPGIESMNQMNSTPSFDTQAANTDENTNSQNPFSKNQNIQDNSSVNNNNNSDQNLHNEISKAKLDTISSKMEILEHKVSNIDNKLDLILKLIQAEVSTETKIKVNMDEKMSQFR
jgi:hypothetical protein